MGKNGSEGRNTMQGKSKNLDMTQGSPVKLLVLFAIPMLIGSIFQQMYNMVDTIVVGRYVSLTALAAIGATTSTTMFIMFVGQGMTNAVSVVISQAEGAKRGDLIRKSVAHAVYLVAISGVVMGAASLFGARPLMLLLGAPDDIIENAVLYVQITGGLTAAQMTYNAATSILRAIGDSRTPLYFLIFSSFLNVGLDLLFVLQFNGGVAGVAWATVLSQAISAVLCVLYMLRRYPHLRPGKDAWQPDGAILREYLRIGLPMILQSMTLCIGMFVITAVINSHGSAIVAAYTIGGKVESLATMSFSNLAFAFSVYAGQNYGAKKYDRIREALVKGLGIITALALVSTLVMMFFAQPIALIFMEEADPSVLPEAVSMVRIEAAFYIFLGAIWAVNSTLRGVGRVQITLVSSIVELVSKIGVSVFLPLAIGSAGIWAAAPTGWVLGLIPSAFYLFRWFRHPEARPAAAPPKA